MTFDELLAALKAICPNGIMSEDAGGELVFATGFRESNDGNLAPVENDT